MTNELRDPDHSRDIPLYRFISVEILVTKQKSATISCLLFSLSSLWVSSDDRKHCCTIILVGSGGHDGTK